MRTIRRGWACRSCGSEHCRSILDLGVQPLANNLPRPEDLEVAEPRFPLSLVICEDCWLMQISDLVPPVQLFSDYVYFSSFSDTMLRHAEAAADRYIGEFLLGPESFVCEIASNDGYMLRNFVRRGIPCLGIDPAQNIVEAARKVGVETLCAFFTEKLGASLAEQGKQADLILGNNVFPHVPTTNDMVAGMEKLLKPSGSVILEFPYGVEFLHQNEFDTIYHEHVFYFTLISLQPLFRRHGLEIYRAETIPIHGGSLRIYACHTGARPVEESVLQLLKAEHDQGFATITPYLAFNEAAQKVRNDLRALIEGLKIQGHTIAAYGASAKGSTLLNFCGIDDEWIDFVVDRSHYKQGRLTPSTHIPIVAAEELLARQPDYTLLLTWNFADEILAQQAAYRQKGGKFILPIPKVRVV